MSWTDERRERAKTLWRQGQSASQIAKQLGGGLTRNAVIGLIHRAGLKRMDQMTSSSLAKLNRDRATVRRVQTAKAAAQPSAGTLRAPPVAKGPDNPLGRKAGKLRAPPVERALHMNAGLSFRNSTLNPAINVERFNARAWQPLPGSAPVRFLDLKPHHCRWMLGAEATADSLCCGAKAIPGKPYCEPHARMANPPSMQPTKKQKARDFGHVQSLLRRAA